LHVQQYIRRYRFGCCCRCADFISWVAEIKETPVDYISNEPAFFFKF
jgi:hypothetical protein